MNQQPAEIQVKDIDHLGIVAGIIDQMGWVDAVNELVGVHSLEQVSTGQVLKAMILNGLGFVAAPLYLFSEFFEGKATEHLIGEGVKPEHLNDDRLGRALDKFYALGVTQVFTKLALKGVEQFEVLIKSIHLDSSSFHVDGEYRCESSKDAAKSDSPASSSSATPLEAEADEPKPITITHGYSRDHRPDLKQFIVDTICTADGDVPLFLRVADGNEDDKTAFVQLFEKFREQWTFDGLCVADSALYTANNLKAMKQLKWLTRVPLTLAQATLVANPEVLEVEMTRAGRFILATNVLDANQLSADDALTEYKDQQSNERGFRFLKDPLFFTASVFVKSPKRVEALVMVMGLCLLVYSLAQRQLRQALAQAGEGIKNQVGKLTERPTLRWVFQSFQSVHLVMIDGTKQITNLTPERLKILRFLGTEARRYYHPG
jgi:transposase